jgi:hypothetical protein
MVKNKKCNDCCEKCDQCSQSKEKKVEDKIYIKKIERFKDFLYKIFSPLFEHIL